MELKDRMKQLRALRGLTQMEVAEKLGFKSHNAYSLWESGKTAPSVRDLDRIANIFNVTVMELMFEVNIQSPNQGVDELNKKVEYLERENSYLNREIALLRTLLKQAGIDISKA